MTTEYEQLLSKMVDEKKAKLAEVTGKKGKEKESATIMSDIRFLEVELQRYQQGMALFRTKSLPKVGRWGNPEAEEKREEVA
jgi:arginine utilization protein RocB